MIKAVRGTRDLLPPETALWNFVEAAVRDVFRAYNFQEIRTPIFEETALFERGVGEDTDVVVKEMYTWEDGGSSADKPIWDAWQIPHSDELEALIEPQPLPGRQQASRFGPSLQVKVKGEWTLVRARYAPTIQDLHQLEQSGRSWQAMRQGKDVRL